MKIKTFVVTDFLLRFVLIGLIEALISSSFDKDPEAKQAICDSLSLFGKKQPNLVLNAVHFFLANHSKVSRLFSF